jgi:hypothetical protein
VEISFDGHVLWKRMAIGPLWASAAGAATLAAAPAAATFRKLRRLEVLSAEVLSLCRFVMAFSPDESALFERTFFD